MIPEKYIDAYKGIKAPKTLRDRVVASAESTARRTRFLPRMIAAAAVLVLVIAAVLVWRIGGAGIGAYVLYDGQPVDTSAEISVPKTSISFGLGTSVPGGIKLEVHVTDTTTVTVTNGSVTLVDANGTPTDTGNSVTLSDDTDFHTVYWQADFYMVQEGASFSLTLKDAHGSVTYTLISSDGELTLQKDSKN